MIYCIHIKLCGIAKKLKIHFSPKGLQLIPEFGLAIALKKVVVAQEGLLGAPVEEVVEGEEEEVLEEVVVEEVVEGEEEEEVVEEVVEVCS